ncbi:MAG: cofactor-independent phosphoglycerate mutase [Methanomicrobiales archaeon]|nr:cofactor-independent phosphoglycerate mutase [Methanomicrobiales archaeon]MDD1657546.1 cofactor-independent phosphoglycerate mutase [Methanomicrobiales archaeon]
MTDRRYLVVLGDGMADEPLEELGGKTPLEYARTPHFDRIAREGACGLLRTIPPGFEAGSDIANLSILGYDPARYYTGRGPLEAASIGVDLAPEDVAYRCNLVTVKDGVMEDFTAGHISSDEGARLIRAMDGSVEGALFYPGISYRNLLVLERGKGAETTPPHDITGMPIDPHLPLGWDGPILRRAMERSIAIFEDQEVNRSRIREGKRPATMIWPWSGGKRPALPSFRERYGLSGGIIAAVDLLNGIARYAGMEVIRVPGATGYLDTDYQAKARYAVAALERLDFLYLHVEAPDEAGHMGSVEEKVRAIERVDGMVGTILESFEGVIAVLPDHPTPIRAKTHTADPVPFAIRGLLTDGTTRLTEREAARGAYGMRDGVDLVPLLIGRGQEHGR